MLDLYLEQRISASKAAELTGLRKREFVRLVLDELRQTDFRVSDRVYREVLTRAGEG